MLTSSLISMSEPLSRDSPMEMNPNGEEGKEVVDKEKLVPKDFEATTNVINMEIDGSILFLGKKRKSRWLKLFQKKYGINKKLRE